jgi:hypothetical protein
MLALPVPPIPFASIPTTSFRPLRPTFRKSCTRFQYPCGWLKRSIAIPRYTCFRIRWLPFCSLLDSLPFCLFSSARRVLSVLPRVLVPFPGPEALLRPFLEPLSTHVPRFPGALSPGLAPGEERIELSPTTLEIVVLPLNYSPSVFPFLFLLSLVLRPPRVAFPVLPFSSDYSVASVIQVK